MNQYRVDRNDALYVPAGMNSIRYIGDSLDKAKEAFRQEPIGFDTWGAPDPTYGVILSEWNDFKQAYVIKASKGIPCERT